MLLLNNILQRIYLLVQLAFYINGAPFVIFAHSVKSVFYRVHGDPRKAGTQCLVGLTYGSPRACGPHRAASPTVHES